jgi:hypothetical protein
MRPARSDKPDWLEGAKHLFFGPPSIDDNRYREDTDQVIVCAQLLQVSEFHFFGIAYAQWYDREIPEQKLEPIFTRYAFKEVVPPWVRHFARRVLALSEAGTLDPEDFNIERPKGSPELRSAGIGYTVILAIVTTLFCLFIGDFAPLY